MDILQEMTAERDRLSKAIEILSGDSTKKMGRAKGTRLSPAARAKIAAAARKRWAQAKRAGKNHL